MGKAEEEIDISNIDPSTLRNRPSLLAHPLVLTSATLAISAWIWIAMVRAALVTQAPLTWPAVLWLVRPIVAGLLTGGACSIIVALSLRPEQLMRTAVSAATLVSWREHLRLIDRTAVLGYVAVLMVGLGHSLILCGPVTGRVFFASVFIGLLPLYWLQRRIYQLSWHIIRQVRANAPRTPGTTTTG